MTVPVVQPKIKAESVAEVQVEGSRLPSRTTCSR
jgi:hypothetical protein